MRRATVHLRHPRFLVVLGAILLLLAIAPAFTAANIDNETRSAGESTDTVSGYTLSSTSVSLNATTPSNVDSVSFTAAGPMSAWAVPGRTHSSPGASPRPTSTPSRAT